MDPVSLTVGLCNLGCALLCVILARPLVRRRIAPNHWYGVRFSRAFSSEEAWYEVNAYGGRRLIFWSVPVAAAGVVALLVPLEGRTWPVILLAMAPLLYVIGALESWRYSQRF
jgi:hypothetical protein